MLQSRTLSIALWASKCVAFGGEDFQLNKAPDMVSLSEAAARDILLPDTVANFTEWIGGSNELAAFGLRPRQLQCANTGYSVSAVVPEVAHAFLAAAALVTPDNADHLNVTSPLHKSAAVPAMPVSRDKIASMEAAAAAGRSSAALLVATTQTLQFAAEALEEIVPKGMIAWKGAVAVHLARSVAVTVNATTLEQRPAALDLELSGRVQGVTSVVRADHAPNLQLKSVVRMARICPAATRSITSTDTVTTTSTKTVRVTTDIEPDTGNAPEFTCVPMTATNDEGATLELDDGCVLHYAPPEATSTEEAAARLRRDAETAPVNLNAGLGLLARQASCTPYTTFTRTVWETETSTETGTRTVTIQGEDGTFSCPEMEVTNDVGDVLALDAECALSFSPAEVTSTAESEDATAQDEPTAADQGVTATAQSTPSTTASAPGESQSDNAGSVDGVHGMLMLGFAGFSLLWIVS
ncbi:hypothetical protein KAF25_008659 [Fusarium avenaceum]|uniref:Uncharacterized protein n=1 Tax=Fusarium avenaceum TaxID=40199 RepID=A0A9P7HB34_9HYPO|nr:hypothetical protein KAF25_008659 [Fusarium avenaceum]